MDRVKPDRVRLNTVARPPTEEEAGAVDTRSMTALKRLFPGDVDIICEGPPAPREAENGSAGIEEAILALLARRPCTLEHIAGGLGLHPNEVVKALNGLRERGTVEDKRVAGRPYYSAVSGIYQD